MKITPPENFHYPSPGSSQRADFRNAFCCMGEGVYKWTVENSRWEYKSQARPGETLFDPAVESPFSATLGEESGIRMVLSSEFVFASQPGRAFGFCASKWVMNFMQDPAMRFYGMGEKNIGFEKSGARTTFWNTDVWADFDLHAVEHGVTDPMYSSIPCLLIVHPGGCVGMLLDNPFESFMILGANERGAQQKETDDPGASSFCIGSSNGTPVVYFICGATPAEVTCTLQRLCGTVPRPPLWALGNHQCRWGYASLEDLEEVDRQHSRHQIPCDGLWLDIDYMDQYRVFTCHPGMHEKMQERISCLKKKNRRIVAILDPGVKKEPGYPVYDSGVERNVFCKTPEDDLYTGYVWPGRTVFPDFSLPDARAWWAAQVVAFTRHGFDGYWLDMNDPSTGSADCEEMRFDGGRDDHASFHNQYALGMQRATREGLLTAAPDLRPFLLSRSASVGSSRESAIWTGDNYSNEHHLRKSIEISLGLSLSGLPFNGPDVPGFGGDCDAVLAALWYKAGFLFPFFRNHSIAGSAPQEPWRFPPATRELIARYIRLRYSFLPYLYHLFVEQESTGHPILRPVFYEFPGQMETFDRMDDQFMIGPSILQAPFLSRTQKEREVILPEGEWFDAAAGQWIPGGGHQVAAGELSTPLYLRSGSAIPMWGGAIQTTAEASLCEIEVHFTVRPGEKCLWEYTADDGLTLGYQRGEQTRISAEIRANATGISMEIHPVEPGWHPVQIVPVCYDPFEHITVRNEGQERTIPLTPAKQRLAGSVFRVFTGEPFPLHSG